MFARYIPDVGCKEEMHHPRHRFLRVTVLCVVFCLMLGLTLALIWLLTHNFGEDGRLTYVRAQWLYNADARFDNTWGTYVTDYLLAALFAGHMLRLCAIAKPSSLRVQIYVLLLFYSASTGLGGIIHHWHDGSHFPLNSLAFRASWTLVVGFTAAAGGVFGLIANSIWRLNSTDSSPMLPDLFWIAWSVLLSVLVLLGAFSCMRPACDIFIAGTTMSLPTMYLHMAVLSCPSTVATWRWWLLQAGLLGNIPCIFVYPWFVQRSGLQLGAINALLHLVLALSWSFQAIGLTHVCHAISGAAVAPPGGQSTNTHEDELQMSVTSAQF